MEQRLKLLYAEDDLFTADETTEALEEYGFDVRTVHDGDAAWEAFRASTPDIVLLDYRMPGKNGLEVFRLIRGENPTVPVLILSSHTEYSVLSLKTGTADFIRKDAGPEETCLRLEIAWRNSRGLPHTVEAPPPDQIYYLGEECSYNAANFTLTINRHTRPLNGMAGTLLTILCQNQNHCVSTAQLCRRLWNVDTPHKTACLREYISDLRKLLQDAPSVHLRAIYGKGYCLETLRLR